MSAMISEIYDAFRDAHGVSDDKARKAAEAVADFKSRFADLALRIERVDGRVSALTWMMGTNITLTLLVLGRLFLLRS
jgi:hypothetical protein